MVRRIGDDERTRRRELILRLYKAGNSIDDIIRRVDAPRNSVRRILRKKGLIPTVHDFEPVGVCQFLNDDVLVAEYGSIMEAAEKTGLNREGIRRSVHGIRKMFKGYAFYAKSEICNNRNRDVLQVLSTPGSGSEAASSNHR